VRAALLAALLGGCMVRVPVTTTPVLAELRVAEQRFRAPAEVRLRWTPLRRPQLTAVSPGYRAAVVRVPLGWGPLALRGVDPIEIVLLPEHGPAGTWSPDEVP
jgi:hypothetical protein